MTRVDRALGLTLSPARIAERLDFGRKPPLPSGTPWRAPAQRRGTGATRMSGEGRTSENAAQVIKAEIRTLDLEARVMELSLAIRALGHVGQPARDLALRLDEKVGRDLVVQLSRVLWQREPEATDPWDPWHEGP